MDVNNKLSSLSSKINNILFEKNEKKKSGRFLKMDKNKKVVDQAHERFL